jgi:hypothetical protein
MTRKTMTGIVKISPSMITAPARCRKLANSTPGAGPVGLA